MKKLLLALFLAFASPSLAADGWIALESQKSTDPAPNVNKQAISDADMTRVATWAAAHYFPQGVANGDGTFRQPTLAEIFKALTDDVYADIKGKVEQWYLQQAEAAARQSVAPITLTPVP